MRTVTIEKSGNNYTVNPNASPSPDTVTFHAWGEIGYNPSYYTLSGTPDIGDIAYSRGYGLGDISFPATMEQAVPVTALGEGTITINYGSGDYTYARMSEYDIVAPKSIQ